MREIRTHLVDSDPPGRRLVIRATDARSPSGANHAYVVEPEVQGPYLGTTLRFQKGTEEVDGLTMEALLAVVADRLEGLQDGRPLSQYDTMALYHTREALSALTLRAKAAVVLKGAAA